MAKSDAVWGIDVGQCAFKALRCRPGDEDGRITADAFDYIEYPKILSQPEADPAELIRDAMQLFLSRNDVRNDRVAMSVSGQSGLARFIKLPPVESRKIPDIVKYEARQQIPFALDDVVWDYQRMVGGSEEEGFALETEVGLFAMKRDQVYRALKPFIDAGIEVDIIQLTPLTIYNFTVFDQIQNLPAPEDYDPEDPPESVVVLSLGTDTTDLVVTNGFRVWQRSVPIGGNHFTKALSKELRLTFAKAEHLKRNATQADDPKAVFQAMRPVFTDLLTEIQRSMGYFTSIDRRAKIGRVVALGNAMRLPGLQRFLSQNLGYPVSEVSEYRALSGASVTTAPAFKENLLSYAVSYGLALQGLGQSKLSTNLLPAEIIVDRRIRAKKPWAVATLAALLLGFGVSFLGDWQAWSSASEGFDDAFHAADAADNTAKQHASAFEEARQKYKDYQLIGEHIVGNVDGRLLWLELMKAITSALPPTDPTPPDLKKIMDRKEIHIDHIKCEHFADLATWYSGVSPSANAQPAAGGAAGDPMAAQAPPPAAPTTSVAPAVDAAAQSADAGGGATGPTGEGWVIEIGGYHFHNKNREGEEYVRETLLKNLKEGKVELPVGPKGAMEPVTMQELGITYPVIAYSSNVMDVKIIDKNAVEEAAAGRFGARAAGPAIPVDPEKIAAKRYSFLLQFAWKPTPLNQRLQQKEAKAKAAAEAAATAASTQEASP